MLQLFLQALDQGIFVHSQGGFRLDLDVLHRVGEGQGAVALLGPHGISGSCIDDVDMCIDM